MRHKCNCIAIVVMAMVMMACNRKPQNSNTPESNQNYTREVRYAKHFNIESEKGYSIFTLFGNRIKQDTTAVFILYDSLLPDLKFNAQLYTIKIPCTRIAALSSIYAAMLAELNALDQLVAIDNIDYINQINILEKHKSGKLKELSKGPEIDLEKTVLLNPDMVLMFGMGNPEEESPPQLRKAGIPVAMIVDHLEETPLARAEWIKFVAGFAGKQKQADSIFKKVELNYLKLKSSKQHLQNKPKVLSELKYGDTWFVPGGKSFMASFIRDAGAEYVWKDNESMGSLPLSFEQVYRKAADADIWINLSMVQNKAEMFAQEERDGAFKAFKNGLLYNNNKRVNAKGYSDYWETAMFHPDRVLSDLIQIFHTSEVQEKELYYYRKIR